MRIDGLWVGPAAAVLAGIVAVGGRLWSREALVLVVLAGLGWGSIWWATAGTDWATMRERWYRWCLPGSVNLPGVLPYTQVGSPASRLAQWWAELSTWTRVELWPARAPQLGVILVGVPMALALGAALGPQLLLVTLGVVATSQMALFWGPADGRSSPVAQAVVEMGIPWAAGGVMLDRLTGGVLAVGVGLVLAYCGLVRMGRSNRAGAWLALGHGVVVLALVVLGRPLGAAAVGALYCSQLALLPWSPSGLDGRAARRLAQWPFLAVVAIAAVAL